MLTTAGALSLAAILTPADVSAQCRTSGYNSGGRGYTSGHGYRSTGRHVRSPRRVVRVYTSPRILTHSHYRGPIYYRNTRSYCAPRVTHYRPTYVAPWRTHSYGHRSSYGYRSTTRR